MPCTILSVLPFEIVERKPGLFPDEYRIPKGSADIPGKLVVDRAVFYVTLEGGNSIAVPVQASELARSLVDDYIDSQLGINKEQGVHPGIGWVEGAPEDKTLIAVIAQLKTANGKWYRQLCRLADDDWARHRKHSLITQTQRLAAKALDYPAEWAVDTIEEVKRVQCLACRSFNDAETVVCPTCRCVLDEKKHKQLTFA